MSTIGSPLDTSLVQAAQAQQTASKARDRERAAAERTQRYTDMLDLKAAGVVSAEAARELPRNDSEEADHDREGRNRFVQRDADEDPHIDVTA